MHPYEELGTSRSRAELPDGADEEAPAPHNEPDDAGLERAEVLSALFELADADRDGRVSQSAVRQLLALLDMPAERRRSSEEQVSANQFLALVGERPIPPELSARWARTLASAFSQVDRDGSCCLNASELARAVRLMGLSANDEELGALFAFLDVDGSGRVTAIELACALPPPRADGSKRYTGSAGRPLPALLARGFAGHGGGFDLSRAVIVPSWSRADEEDQSAVGSLVADALTVGTEDGDGGGPRGAARRTGGLTVRQADALQHLPVVERVGAWLLLRLDRIDLAPRASATLRAAGKGDSGQPRRVASESRLGWAVGARQAEGSDAVVSSSSSGGGGSQSPRPARRERASGRRAALGPSLSPPLLLAATWPVRRRALLAALCCGCAASSISTYAAPISAAMLGAVGAGRSGAQPPTAASRPPPSSPPSPPPAPSARAGAGVEVAAAGLQMWAENVGTADVGTPLWRTRPGQASAATLPRAHRPPPAQRAPALLNEELSEALDRGHASVDEALHSLDIGSARERARLALEGALMLTASLLEVLALYALALGAVMAITRAAGLALTPVDAERAFVISALARAALQLGNPTEPDARHRIDPLRRASRLRLCLAALLWKGKSVLATTLVKLLLKRVLARAASEDLLRGAAVPVIGLCDALVLHLALLDCLAIAQAPLLTAHVLDSLVLGFGTARVSADVRRALFRAVGCAIVRIEAHHPACALLLAHLERLVGRPERHDVLDDEELLLAQLPLLSPRAQQLALRLLLVALAADGQVSALEREFVMQAARLCAAVDVERAERALDAAANALADGRALDVAATLRLFPLVGEAADGDDDNDDEMDGAWDPRRPATYAGAGARALRGAVRRAVRSARTTFKVIC